MFYTSCVGIGSFRSHSSSAGSGNRSNHFFGFSGYDLDFVGMKKSTYAVLLGAGITLPFIAWRFILKPYQKQRIYTFLNIDADPLALAIILNRL